MATSLIPKLNRRTALYLSVSALTFLIFFHPTLAFNARAIVDDQCYLDWLGRWLFFHYDGCPNQYTFPGTTFIWLPGAAIARIIALFTHTSFIAAITTSIGISSFICWTLTLFLFADIVKSLTENERERLYLPLLFLFAIPALHYATVRTTMTHISEIFFATATFALLLRKKHVAAFAIGILLTITRINDAPILVVILAAFLDQRKRMKWLAPFATIAFLISLPIIRIAMVTRYGGHSPYAVTLIPVIKNVSWEYFCHMLVGDHFSMLLTATFWLGVLAIGTPALPRLSWMSRAGIFWMWLLFLVSVGWGDMGSAFGYRYIIGTYPMALIVWFELRKKGWITKLRLNTASYLALGLNAIWLTHLTWIYDHYSSAAQLLAKSEGVLFLKQMAHPIFRLFHFSPLALSIRYLQGATPESLAFNGPFQSSLTSFQLFITVALSFAALFILFIGFTNFLRTRKVDESTGLRTSMGRPINAA